MGAEEELLDSFYDEKGSGRSEMSGRFGIPRYFSLLFCIFSIYIGNSLEGRKTNFPTAKYKNMRKTEKLFNVSTPYQKTTKKQQKIQYRECKI